MPPTSTLINRAHSFSKLQFWKKAEQAPLSNPKPGSFTSHMVALVAKLVNMRGSDATIEFKALCKVFHLAPGVRKKLLSVYVSALRDPLPAEYHAKQIAKLYAEQLGERDEVLERLIRIATASRSFIARDEYYFLRSMAEALSVSQQHFIRLCGRYEIEIPSDNPYIVLGVNRLSSKKEIKTKYHRLVREYHPDTVGAAGYSTSEAQAFNQKLVEINQAYSALRELAV